MQDSKNKISTMANHEYMINKKILDTIDNKGDVPTVAIRKPFWQNDFSIKFYIKTIKVINIHQDKCLIKER